MVGRKKRIDIAPIDENHLDELICDGTYKSNEERLQLQHCARLIEADPDLELVAPVPLNIVCFRFAPRDGRSDGLNGVNQEILLRVQESGLAVLSSR